MCAPVNRTAIKGAHMGAPLRSPFIQIGLSAVVVQVPPTFLGSGDGIIQGLQEE